VGEAGLEAFSEQEVDSSAMNTDIQKTNEYLEITEKYLRMARREPLAFERLTLLRLAETWLKQAERLNEDQRPKF